MASAKEDKIDFDKLEQELSAAVTADERYWRENDAKFRAVNQKVATYDEFRDIVLAAHLKPLEKTDKIQQDRFKQPWNTIADSASLSSSNTSDTDTLQKMEIKIPNNGHEFAQSWRRHCKTSQDKLNYLRHIGSKNLQAIFKAEISFGLLGEIIDALLNDLSDNIFVVEVLESLTLAGRFGLSLTFLSSSEKENCEKLFSKLDGEIPEDNTDLKNMLEKLREKFQVKTSS
ncbi:coiled-coil domain-containing protein 103 [Lingula anatina]|uniref:Coiled-coil domain-containing protein 103 n=1 Tax=Lingula anatina TaxID=7574 RepID=A0A1S3JAE8_LINAN|nr:coiled-coil domain-containing protein 103 [Lingula anatina]|eukprot:XP_013407380.1 coiled-coil domain-containing protein 103 [Lingula anatina]